jgi:hypothetical protein
MRHLAAAVLAVLAVLVPASAASAKQPAPARWAKRHHLKGHWRAKDADRDGLSNLREFKLKTDPRRADTDRDGLDDGDELRAGDDPRAADTDGDGVKDGAEHAGVVTAFDGTTLTVRQFHGGTITAAVDADVDCYTAGDSGDDSTADDDVSSGDDDTSAGDDTSGDDAADDDVVDLTGDDDSADDTEPTCADAGVQPGAVVAHLELDRDDAGGLVVSEIELA